MQQPEITGLPEPLDWSALRDFLAVSETGSLSRAALKLGVSQPTLTRRMAALEERLRAELFRRTPRGIELTEAGESVLSAARQMEQEAHSLELSVSGRDTALAGLVLLGQALGPRDAVGIAMVVVASAGAAGLSRR